MATLNLTAKEFADIGIMWLFDQVMNPEQIENEHLKEFIDDHRSKLRTPLMKYYLDSPTKSRVNYKRIKGVFDGSDQSIQQIRVAPDAKKAEKEKEKEGITKKIAKKVIKKILAKEELDVEDINFLKELTDVDT